MSLLWQARVSVECNSLCSPQNTLMFVVKEFFVKPAEEVNSAPWTAHHSPHAQYADDYSTDLCVNNRWSLFVCAAMHVSRHIWRTPCLEMCNHGNSGQRCIQVFECRAQADLIFTLMWLIVAFPPELPWLLLVIIFWTFMLVFRPLLTFSMFHILLVSFKVSDILKYLTYCKQLLY